MNKSGNQKKKFTGKTGGIIGNQNKTNKQKKIVDTKRRKILYKYIKPEIKKNQLVLGVVVNWFN